jgi:hydroxymethylpyrimidine/phosphomethylpyrimidine kinase
LPAVQKISFANFWLLQYTWTRSKFNLAMAKNKTKQRPVILSIAGYDPSSGAGITADIKTIAAHGCYGVTCITALTVQSTQGVKRVDAVEGRIITETLEELMDDLDIAAVKVGMLGSAEAAKAVSAFLRRYPMRRAVVDPIVKSSSGADLISKEGLQVLKDRILAQAYVITPNIEEAAALTGLKVGNADDMEPAAMRLHAMGARNVIITGGHLDVPVDFVSLEMGKRFMMLKGRRIAAHSTHGTGCAFATALTCNLALGKELTGAAKDAKRFVQSALHGARSLGKGIGPVI